MTLKNTKWSEQESIMATAFVNIANSLPYIQQMMKQHVKSAQNGGGIINDGDLQEVLNQLAEMINNNLHNVSQSRVSFTMTSIAPSRTGSQSQQTAPKQTQQVPPTTTESCMRNEKIRLSESQLHKMIKESVKKVLRESDYMDDGDLEPQYDENREHSWPLFGVADYDPHFRNGSGRGDKNADNEASWEYFDAVRLGADLDMSERLKRDYNNNIKTPDPYKRGLRDYMNGWNEEKKDWDTPVSMMKDDFDKRWEETKNIKKFNRQADSRPLHRKGSLNREL